MIQSITLDYRLSTIHIPQVHCTKAIQQSKQPQANKHTSLLSFQMSDQLSPSSLDHLLTHPTSRYSWRCLGTHGLHRYLRPFSSSRRARPRIPFPSPEAWIPRLADVVLRYTNGHHYTLPGQRTLETLPSKPPGVEWAQSDICRWVWCGTQPWARSSARDTMIDKDGQSL